MVPIPYLKIDLNNYTQPFPKPLILLIETNHTDCIAVIEKEFKEFKLEQVQEMQFKAYFEHTPDVNPLVEDLAYSLKRSLSVAGIRCNVIYYQQIYPTHGWAHEEDI